MEPLLGLGVVGEEQLARMTSSALIMVQISLLLASSSSQHFCTYGHILQQEEFQASLVDALALTALT